MAKVDCYNAIKKALFKDGMSPNQDSLLRATLDDLERIRDNPNGEKFSSRVREYYQQQQELTVLQKGIKTKNLEIARENLKEAFQPAFEGRPDKQVAASLSGGRGVFKMGQGGVGPMQQAHLASYMNILASGIEESGITPEILQSRALDKDLRRTIFEINKNGKVPTDVDPKTLQIARAMYGLNRQVFSDIRKAGVPVAYLDSFVSKQYHDRAIVNDAGFENWRNDVRAAGIDTKKTFGKYAGDNNTEEQILRSIYDGIIKGSDRELTQAGITDQLLTTGGGHNTGAKLSESRVLRFLDAEGEHAYAEKYSGGSLLENIIKNSEQTARMLPLIERFGTNPEAGFQGHLARIERQLKLNGDDKGLKTFQSKREQLNDLFKEATGATSVPGVSTKAKLSNVYRTVKGMAVLGFSGISTGATNWAVTAATLRSQTGEGFLTSFGKGTKAWFKSLPAETRNDIARKSAMYVDELVGHSLTEITGGHFGEQVSGVTSKMQRLYFKLNGLEKITNGARTAFASVMQHDLATKAHLPFEKLNAGLQGGFAKAGIGKAEWAALSQGIETAQGRYGTHKIVSIEAFRKLPDETIKKVMSEHGVLNTSVETFKRSTELKYGGYFAKLGDQAATHTTLREKGFINAGTTADSWEGFARRLVAQYKTYPLQIMDVMANIHLNNPDPSALAQGKFIQGKGDLAGTAQLVAAMVATTYVAESIRNLLAGKDLDNPLHPSTFVEMLQKSGMGGLGADYLFGEAQDTGRGASTLLGPALGDIGKAVNITGQGVSKALSGKKQTSTEKQAVKFARGFIPGQNLPFVKGGMDYIQNHVIMEALDPGYLSKEKMKEQRALRSNPRSFTSQPETIKNPIKKALE